MRKATFLAVFLVALACNKKSDEAARVTTAAAQKVKYQVTGSATAYEVTYTNEAGQSVYDVVSPGWSTVINAREGQTYKFVVTPRPDCARAGSGGIYFDDSLKVSKSVSTFTENVPNSSGGTSCGFQIQVTN